MEVFLIYSDEEGSKEIKLEKESLSLGRSPDADMRLNDEGLSRIHARLFSENERIWITDENSTNGSFVNGVEVSPSGTPLKNGDIIKIGNHTRIKVKTLQSGPKANHQKIAPAAIKKGPSRRSFPILAVLITLLAFSVIGISAVIIGYKTFGSQEIAINNDTDDDFITSRITPEDKNDEKDTSANENKTPEKTPRPTGKANQSGQPREVNTSLTNSPESKPGDPKNNIPIGKKYSELSDTEKKQYVAARAEKVANLIGNKTGNTITPLAIERIKGFLDAYAKRVNASKMKGCKFGDNLGVTLERASKNAPFIIHSFNSEGIDPQIGLYLAMIESEHCTCLQSPTGPLGMFQFTKATGEAYGLRVFRGASPSNPDERCDPEPASRAAAKYMKFLQGRYGTDPSSVPLAIGSYNSGEGGLSKNLTTALESNEGLPRDFWSLIANGEKLSKQFQSENFKYVPKFFAAAIIGENPQDFGVNLQPLSTYTK